MSWLGGCLVADGRAYCWGQNLNGRLGIGSSQNNLHRIKPAAVKLPEGVLDVRRVQTISLGTAFTAAIAVKTPKFKDISASHPFADDIGWLAGAGIAQGFDTDNTYKSGQAISRQAMAAFLFRFKNPGVPAPTCAGNARRFQDVPKSSPFCGAVEWLVDQGITGVPMNKLFHPTVPITRATMAVFLFRSQHPGVPNPLCQGPVRRFADVLANTAHCGTIEWLVRVGVTSGYAGNLYKPTEPVSRGAMAAFMHRVAELTAH